VGELPLHEGLYLLLPRLHRGGILGQAPSGDRKEPVRAVDLQSWLCPRPRYLPPNPYLDPGKGRRDLCVRVDNRQPVERILIDLAGLGVAHVVEVDTGDAVLFGEHPPDPGKPPRSVRLKSRPPKPPCAGVGVRSLTQTAWGGDVWNLSGLLAPAVLIRPDDEPLSVLQ
jgi:hypothetical protein